VLLPFALGYFLSYLYRVVNAVIAPDLTAELGIGPDALGMLTSAYFITFAAFQLPLGVLLDRFGPRKIEALLLLFAASGAFVFAAAQSVWGLVLGRALIGLGVSACLMAAFTAFSMWFSKERLPLVNGVQMSAGGLGAVAATAPVEFLLHWTDWRGLFTLLGVLTLVVAGTIYWVVPAKRPPSSGVKFAEQIRGTGRIFTSLTFWRIAPWATMSQASFLSIQGLWAGPWLRDVAGLERSSVAVVLTIMASGMVFGFLFMGTLAERLGRLGIRPVAVAGAGMSGFMLFQGLVIMEMTTWTTVVWLGFCTTGTTGIVCYADLSQRFPAHMTGRVNTSLNLLVFIAAFICQWGIGVIIDLWPLQADGGYAPQGYQVSFAVLLALQLAGLSWYLLCGAWFRGRLQQEGAAYAGEAA
jgi:MFS family permease